jgi:DnaJ family protein B protein 4
MGGAGGGPSFFTNFGGAGDDDDDMGGFHFPGSGMPGGMPGGAGSRHGRSTPRRPSSPFSGGASPYGNTGGSHPHHHSHTHPTSPSEPAEITRPLKVSLEDLYTGTTKHLKVGRRLLNGGTEDRVLEIAVQPGWKSGTKIRFPKAGNEVPGTSSPFPGGEPQAQDLVFVVEEKPHDRFKREGSDLVTTQKISLVDALTNTGGTRTLVGLDGRRLQVSLPGGAGGGVVKPGMETRVPGEGMPIREKGTVKKKGDVVVKWEVEFPDKLTPAQREGIKKVLG